MEMVAAFKYLGRILTASDGDCPEVVANLGKARKRWVRLSRILGWEGADPRTSGTFYKEVVQGILLIGVETWVVSPRILKTLGGFHHKVARRLVGMRPRQDTTGR